MRAALLLGLVACVHDPIDLTTGEGWTVAGVDPLPEHRPDDARCPVNAWGPEDGVLEVETGGCTYGVFAHHLPPIPPGGRLVGAVWHGKLDTFPAAEAHVAVGVDGHIVWETTVQIPGRADVYDIDVPWPADVAPEAPLVVHLHNHGWHSWRVGTFTWMP